MKSAAVAGRIAVEMQCSADWQSVTTAAIVAHSSKMRPLHPALIISKPALPRNYTAWDSALVLYGGIIIS